MYRSSLAPAAHDNAGDKLLRNGRALSTLSHSLHRCKSRRLVALQQRGVYKFLCLSNVHSIISACLFPYSHLQVLLGPS